MNAIRRNFWFDARHLIRFGFLFVSLNSATCYTFADCQDYVHTAEQVAANTPPINPLDAREVYFFKEIFQAFRKTTTEQLVSTYGSVSAAAAQLTAIGYSSATAIKLVSGRPELTSRIIAATRAGFQAFVTPIKVYRSIGVTSKSEVSFVHKSYSFSKQVFVSSHPFLSVVHGFGSNKPYVAVLELEVPRFFIRRPNLGLSGRFIPTNYVPSLEPFLVRTSEVEWTDHNNFKFKLNWDAEGTPISEIDLNTSPNW